MNRQGLQELIAFGILLSHREAPNGMGLPTEQQAARDALELSRLAKRLHYLGDQPASPFGLDKMHRLETRANAILAPYGYWAWYATPGPVQLCVVLVGRHASPQERLAVPY